MCYCKFSRLLLLFIAIISFTSTAQTQLLKPGNASCYMLEPPGDLLNIVLEKVTINGVEYFKRKNWYMPWFNSSSGSISYERISGDSCYYVRSRFTGTDSLIFNFNWPVGKVIKSDTALNNIYEQRIDSIVVENVFVPEDTIFYISGYTFDLNVRDTLFWLIPEFAMYSRKFGQLDFGITGGIIGVKIDGIRYGTVYPYPEEITFPADSLKSYQDQETVFTISNSSGYDVVIDTAFNMGMFIGYTMSLIRGSDSIYYSFLEKYPYNSIDTLNFLLPNNDSVLVRMRIEARQNYIDDTIGFIMHFKGEGIENSYYFNRTIPVSGFATVLGDASDDKVLPDRLHLYQNYPNPFNPVTTIKYSINKPGIVNIAVIDLLGREVVTLLNEYQEEGIYQKQFNSGSLSSGVYLYRLKFMDKSFVKKLIILK